MAKKNRVSLGIDMGTKNTMLAIAHPSKGFLETKHFQNPIMALVDAPNLSLMKAVRRFKKEFNADLDRYKPSRVTAERFLTRGFRGAGIECICLMLGIMSSVCADRGIKFKAITASTWKNNFNRRFGGNKTVKPLNDLYKQFKLKERHYIDAFLIAHYRFDSKFSKLTSLTSIAKSIRDAAPSLKE